MLYTQIIAVNSMNMFRKQEQKTDLFEYKFENFKEMLKKLNILFNNKV